MLGCIRSLPNLIVAIHISMFLLQQQFGRIFSMLMICHSLSQLEKDQWLEGGDKYKWAMQHLKGEVEGVGFL